jgi:hypothetical protein
VERHNIEEEGTKLPTKVARDLEAYAQAEHISAAEAAVKFIQSGLKAQTTTP